MFGATQNSDPNNISKLSTVIQRELQMYIVTIFPLILFCYILFGLFVSVFIVSRFTTPLGRSYKTINKHTRVYYSR